MPRTDATGTAAPREEHDDAEASETPRGHHPDQRGTRAVRGPKADAGRRASTVQLRGTEDAQQSGALPAASGHTIDEDTLIGDTGHPHFSPREPAHCSTQEKES